MRHTALVAVSGDETDDRFRPASSCLATWLVSNAAVPRSCGREYQREDSNSGTKNKWYNAEELSVAEDRGYAYAWCECKIRI